MFPNLRAEMARKQIRTLDIAHLLGVSEKTTRNYLNGKSKISWLDVLTIQKSFFPKLKVSYLFQICEKKKVS